MNERQKSKATLEKLTHAYNTSSPYENEFISLNWVAIFVTFVIAIMGALFNRLATGSWMEINAFIVVITIILAAISLQ